MAAADWSHALDVLEERCRREPGAVLGHVLARLRAHPEDVALALKGTPLYVRHTLDGGPAEGWVVFTGDGHVAVLGDDAVRPERTFPDLIVQGPARAVLAAVLGETEADAALDAGVLIPMVPMDRLEPLLGLLRRELIAVAAGYTES